MVQPGQGGENIGEARPLCHYTQEYAQGTEGQNAESP